jgi:phage gp46-like protein
MQQGDVLLQQTNDNGDITVVNGVTTMTGSFETTAYLCLFGGNEDDAGGADKSETWWGNLDEIDPDLRYVSETQYLLKSLPAISSNLLKLQAAAERDLAVFTSKSIASSVTVAVSIPALNRVAIAVDIEAVGEKSSFKFTENWEASA